MSLLAKLLKNKYDSFALEDPGYHYALKVFKSFDYEIKKIRINENGIILDELNKSESKLVYITPSHQFPTGTTMPISNRQHLIQWAKKNDAIIIEDDYDSELRYSSRPIPSLQGLDEDENVVFLGTFSKSLSPAIRVSYMVLPPKILKLYKNHFDYDIPRVSIMTQKTLEYFMKEGHWEKHLRKIRTLNKKKHNLMKECLLEELGNTVLIVSEGGGLAIFINPSTLFDWDLLEKLAIKNSIRLHYSKEVSGGKWQAIQMGFGGLKYNEIKDSIKSFSKIWFKCIKE